jgi:hypothetical protein
MRDCLILFSHRFMAQRSAMSLHARNKMTKSLIANSLIGCFIFIFLLVGCMDKRSPKIYNHSNAFIVLQNAEDTFYDLRDGAQSSLAIK